MILSMKIPELLMGEGFYTGKLRLKAGIVIESAKLWKGPVFP